MRRPRSLITIGSAMLVLGYGSDHRAIIAWVTITARS